MMTLLMIYLIGLVFFGACGALKFYTPERRLKLADRYQKRADQLRTGVNPTWLLCDTLFGLLGWPVAVFIVIFLPCSVDEGGGE